MFKVASRWKYIKTNLLTMHGPLNIKTINTTLGVWVRGQSYF